ncbi:unnamed protein product [Rhizoctonia solani]|uniref:DRBM domain-containing protein n=1 Tax=Rhizoctonia solani TaxID=456999 RepID=A0A8H3DZ74_9AGAM|nr:unnamed protein product [Rhizoctonia solani]
MKLNNYLQARGELSYLTWKETSTGPADSPKWAVIAYINGQEYGWGMHRTKQGARHEAARMTLRNLEIMDEYTPRILGGILDSPNLPDRNTLPLDVATYYTRNPGDFVTRLNNYLQARGRLSRLTWKKSATGSNYNLEWTVMAFSRKPLQWGDA